MNHPARDRSSETEPPATSDFGGAATQWNIYDAYMEDQHRLALQKEMQKKQKQQAKDAAQGGDESGKNANAGDAADARLKKKPELMASLPMTKAVRVMERMVNQNSYECYRARLQVLGGPERPVPGRRGDAVTAVEGE